MGDDDYYSYENTLKREQAWREDLLDQRQSWGMLDDQHIGAPLDSPRHFVQWMHNSEEKRRERETASSSGGSGGGGSDASFLSAPFLLIFAVVGILPIALFWHYRKKNWFYLGLTVSLFAVSAAYFLSRTHGDMWVTLFGVEMVFGVVYLPFAATGWVCHRLNDRIAKRVPFKLGAWSWFVLISLAIAFETLFFLWIEGLGWSANLVRFLGQSMVYFGGSTYVRLGTYNDAVTMLMAVFPNAIALSTLQAWFRKRAEQGKQAIPWLLYLPVAWVVGMALFLGFVIAVNHLQRDSHALATIPEDHVLQAAAQPTLQSHARCAQHHKHCKSAR